MLETQHNLLPGEGGVLEGVKRVLLVSTFGDFNGFDDDKEAEGFNVRVFLRLYESIV